MTSALNNAKPSNPLRFGQGFQLPLGVTVSADVLEARYESTVQTLPASVRDNIAAYSPDELEGPVAADVTAFVRMLTMSVAPMNGHTLAQVRAAAAKLTIWAYVGRGLPLLYRLLLSDDLIQLWQKAVTASGELSPGTASNYRGHLRRIAHHMGVELRDEFQPLIRPARTAPHTEGELAEAMLWARTLTKLGSRRARTLIILGAGAGLTADEVRLVRGRDVLTEVGVWVSVGGARPRITPVLPSWAARLRRIAESVAAEEFLFSGPDGQAEPGFVDGWLTLQPKRGRPTSRRLRASYLAEQLRAGADDADVLAWSGLQRGEDLAKYLPFAGESDAARRSRLIRMRSNLPAAGGDAEVVRSRPHAAHRVSGGRA
jgi:integrase